MNLDVKPTLDNIPKLYEYSKTLPEGSAFAKHLVKYEKQLVENNKTVRALERVCNTDNYAVVNKLEGLTTTNWFRTSNIAPIEEIPPQYFDVVLWSDCNLEAELRQAVKIYPKLKPGARVYFDNLLSDFGNVLKNCLPTTSLKALTGQKLSQTYIASNAFAQLVRSLLSSIFKAAGVEYQPQILLAGEKRYIVLIKGSITFQPDSALQEELDAVDIEAEEKFPVVATVTLSPERMEKIKNRVFELVVHKLGAEEPVKIKDLCAVLVKEKLLPDCKVKEVNKRYLNGKHVVEIQDSLAAVKSQIDSLVSVLEVEDPGELFQGVEEIINTNVADEEHWETFVHEYGQEFIESLVDYDEEEYDEEYDEEDETELYPEVEKPEQPLPAQMLVGLSNIGGYSCFMDSVLFAILLPTNGYFTKSLLKKKLTEKDVKHCTSFDDPQKKLQYAERFQTELVKLSNIIHGNEDPEMTCWPIQQQLRRCNDMTQILMSGAQQDDSEFLISLMAVFNLEPTVVISDHKVKNPDTDWKQLKNEELPEAVLEVQVSNKKGEIPELLSQVQSKEISNYQNLPISSWVKDDDDVPYQFLLKQKVISSSKALIFHVPRRLATMTGYIKNTKPIMFREYIVDNANSQYYTLNAVTIHHGGAHGGHYTAYIKYDGAWYHYDDIALPHKRMRITTWTEVANEGSRNGSLFFYYP